jgi:hypothetical protein
MSMGNPPESSNEHRNRDLAAAAEKAPILDFWLRRFAPWATVAALAFTAVWLTRQNLSLRTANESLLTQRRLAEVAYRAAQNQLAERSLLAEGMINNLGKRLHRSEDLARLKIVELVSPTGTTKEIRAVVVWDPEQQTGLLTSAALPATAAGQDYQIWVVDEAYSNPVSGGVFRVATDGPAAKLFKPDQPVRQVSAFSISQENKNGGAKAEGPVVLFGKMLGP